MSAKLKNAIKAVNKAALIYGSVSTLALSGVAFAQEDGMMEEIEVTGIRGALKQALDIKRNKAASVDAISAEDIGKMPDKNLAESLQRIPGVSINRGLSGEGSEVSIRGVNPELTRVSLNGQYVASAGWFSLTSNSRSFNMDMMPSEMVSGVEVYKSPEARLDEGGVGGTVIVRTRRPLDLDPMTVYASVEAMQNSIDTDDDWAPSYTGLVSWKNDAETFGILGMYSQSETIGRGNKSENYWEEAWAVGGISEFVQDRERDSLDLTAQFAPSEALTVTAHYFNVENDVSNSNHNLLLFGGCCEAAGSAVTSGGVDNTAAPIPAISNASSQVGLIGNPMSGTVTGPGNLPSWQGWQLIQDVNFRRAELETEVFDIDVEYVGDGYTISAVVGQTEASGTNGGNVNTWFGIDPSSDLWADNGGNVTVDYDFTGVGSFTINGLDAADPTWQTVIGNPALAEVINTEEDTYAQVDLELDVDWGVINQFLTGIKVRDHEFDKRAFNNVIDLDAINAQNYTAADFNGGVRSVEVAGGTDSIANVSSDWANVVRSNVVSRDEQLNQFGKVEEDMFAIYGQANFETDAIRGNVGMRYVETDVDGTSYVGNTLVTTSGDYSDWLPSINVAMDLSDDIVLRMSAARTMSRPGFTSMNPSFGSINSSSNQATQGNPIIDPFRATQADIGLEWYFDDDALLSAAIFAKDIQSFVSSSTVQVAIPEDNNGDGNFSLAEADGLYTVSVPSLGQGGTIEGIELQYQQAFGDFGMIANYTYADTEGTLEDGSTVDLPGASRNSYNLTGYYENDVVSARIAYTYRDQFLAEGTALGNNLLLNDEQAYLDASIVWHVTEQIDLSLEGVNLTDEEVGAFHNGGLNTPQVTTVNGSRYYLKASFRM